MTLKEFYEEVQGDYNTALTRMMNDGFITRMLTKFTQGTYVEDIIKAYEAKDMKEVFAHSHALKGVCGNLALTTLYNVSSIITEATRNLNENEFINLDNELQSLKDIYSKTLVSFKKYIYQI